MLLLLYMYSIAAFLFGLLSHLIHADSFSTSFWGRVLLSNFVTLLHSAFLTPFGCFNSVYNLRLFLFLLDMIFRIALCVWCTYWGVCQLIVWLKQPEQAFLNEQGDPQPPAFDQQGIGDPQPPALDQQGIGDPQPSALDQQGIGDPQPPALDQQGIGDLQPHALDQQGIGDSALDQQMFGDPELPIYLNQNSFGNLKPLEEKFMASTQCNDNSGGMLVTGRDVLINMKDQLPPGYTPPISPSEPHPNNFSTPPILQPFVNRYP